MLLLVSCCFIRRAFEQESYAVNSYVWLNKWVFFFLNFNPEWLLVPNRLQNRLFFQHLFVPFQCLFYRAELHCTFTILARLLTTRALQHKNIDATAAGVKNNQRDPGVTELLEFLNIISSQSWTNALIFFNNIEGAVGIGRHYLAYSLWISAITLHETHMLLSNR